MNVNANMQTITNIIQHQLQTVQSLTNNIEKLEYLINCCILQNGSLQSGYATYPYGILTQEQKNLISIIFAVQAKPFGNNIIKKITSISENVYQIECNAATYIYNISTGAITSTSISTG